MHEPHTPRNWLQSATRHALLAFGLAMSLSACVGMAGAAGASSNGGDTWQEEVLLHDGRTIMAERYVHRGGRAEVGQSGAYVEQQLSFTDPVSGRTYNWSDSYSPELGMANFLLLALHVVDSVPYVVATPMGCQSYNKWGRPNPPYVIFMAQGNSWQRINLAELPAQARSANLLHSAPDDWVRRHRTRSVTAPQIQAENATNQPQYRSILREPITNGGSSCAEMVSNGKGAWVGIGWFREQPTLSACMNYCSREKFDANTCPCNRIFEGK